MANTVTGSMTVIGDFTNTIGTSTTIPVAYAIREIPSLTVTYTSGTGANAVQKMAYITGSAAASTVDIDLSTIVCSDASTGFSYIRECLVFNDSATDGQVLLLGLGTNPWRPYLSGTTDTLRLEASDVKRISKPLGTHGYTVDSSNKILRLNPGANTITYRVYVYGD